MTKHKNTILFIIAATGFNIILTVMIFIFTFLLFVVFIKPFISDNYVIFGLPVILIISIFLSFTIYRILLKRFLANVNMDDYFDTSFSFKKKKSSPENPGNPESPEKTNK
ncbi:MAG: leader peptide processing enzyme [Spirochaetaceae bacterium]|nr:leader peptide processing enzyme [Spirochaetaceae bacterium]